MDLTNVSTESLKNEITNRGYYVTKKPYRPRRNKCLCGRKVVGTCSTFDGADLKTIGYFFKCPKCGLTSKPGRTKSEAVDNWNKITSIQEPNI